MFTYLQSANHFTYIILFDPQNSQHEIDIALFTCWKGEVQTLKVVPKVSRVHCSPLTTRPHSLLLLLHLLLLNQLKKVIFFFIFG